VSSSTVGDDTGDVRLGTGRGRAHGEVRELPSAGERLPVMDCDQCRAAISAAMDGEDPGAPEEAVRAHVVTCAGCRQFTTGVQELHRSVRVTPAEPVPDLTRPILQTIGDEPARVQLDERTRFLRISLAIIAAIQLGMAVPALVLGDDAGLPTHVARHLGSFALALGVGLLVVAWRPDRAAGVLPVIAAVVVCLLASAVIDIIQGRAAPGAEVSHAPELVGLVAVWLLARAPGETARHQAHPAHPALG
jgi:predicted anti-sigma-YlaC factor YlaD